MDETHGEDGKKSLRNTMLNQEKVFKEQLRELHRLYRIQRALMFELSKEFRIQSVTASSGAASNVKSGFWSSTSDSQTSLSSPFVERAANSAQMNSCYRVGVENKVVVPCSAIGDPPPSIHENLNCSADNTEANNLDLSLRIGPTSGRAKIRKVSRDLDLELAESTPNDIRREITLSGNMPWRERVNGSHILNFSSPGLQCPPWLFQALSLNRT